MFNQVVLVGRLTQTPELIQEGEGKNKRTRVILAVQRAFKSRGKDEYETDFIPITMWEGIAESVASYCKKGNPLIVKGRIEENTYIIKIKKPIGALTYGQRYHELIFLWVVIQ